MNSQLNPTSPLEARIDTVLDALRTAEPPAGLEQRIAARLAQAAEARNLSASPASPSSFFAAILTLSRSKRKDPRILLAAVRRYTAAAAAALTLLFVLTTLTILHHRPATDAAHVSFNSHANSLAQSQAATANLNRADHQVRDTEPDGNPASPSDGIYRTATTQVPRGFSLGSRSPSTTAGVLTPSAAPPDLDTLARAETLAPTRPAPTLPLTAQEKLIQAATRPGQPIQLAELDLARAPALRAEAQARQHATVESYVKTLLAPFALADALQPTTPSQPQEAFTSSPAEPTSNPSN